MELVYLTNPTTLPLTLAEAKKQLELPASETVHDAYVTTLIRRAARMVEGETHNTLIETQFRATWDLWPTRGRFAFPGWPIVSVDKIGYYDKDGAVQTLTPSEFQWQIEQWPATVQPLYNETWPELEPGKVGAVSIELTAGWGVDDTTQPPEVHHAIAVLVAHWFEHREAVVTGTISKEIELAWNALVTQIRVNEFTEFLIQC